MSFKEESGKPEVELIHGVLQTCPVCVGRGLVMQGFYLSTQVKVFSSSGGTETCKACYGRGLVR